MKNTLATVIGKNSSCFLLAVVIAILGAVGRQLDTVGGFRWNSAGLYVWFGVLFVASLIAIFALRFAFKKIVFHKEVDNAHPIRYFCICWAFFFGIWNIILLGVYPGYFCFDAPTQLNMYVNATITAHHPVLHTYLCGSCITFVQNLTGSLEQGIYTFMVLQLIFISCCLAYLMTYLYRIKTSKWLRLITLLWLALFPTNIITNMSVTKDALFTPAFLVFILLSYEMLMEKEKFFAGWKKPATWVGIAFLAAILRNNALIVVLFVIVSLAIKLKKQWKSVLPIIAAFFAVLILYLGPFCNAITVSGVNSKEMLSVPVQQVMRVYTLHSEELAESEKGDIQELFDPVAFSYYNPMIADICKASLHIDMLKQNPSKYLRLWLQLGKRYPKDYVDSLLLNTYGFWYPDATLTLLPTGEKGYFVCYSYPPAVDQSKIKFIFNSLSLFNNSWLVQNNSKINWIFAPATYFIAFIGTLFAICKHKKKELYLPAFAVLLLWLSYIPGPVALVRYVSFLYMLMPFLVICLSEIYHNKKSS